MRLLTVIPARLGSTRLPNKPLRFLAGEPLIRTVARNALEMALPGDLVVATDDARVAEALRPLGVATALTDARHRSGTERVHEVAARLGCAGSDVILNLQGDEPFMTRAAVDGALACVERGDRIGTAAQALPAEAMTDRNRVKVAVDDSGHARHFFRAVPDRFMTGAYDILQHIGIYVFTMSSLEQWMSLPITRDERTEGLEQLRPLGRGMPIGVAALDEAVPPGIDTEADLRMAEVTR